VRRTHAFRGDVHIVSLRAMDEVQYCNRYRVSDRVEVFDFIREEAQVPVFAGAPASVCAARNEPGRRMVCSDTISLRVCSL
jgi:hypothetical protein